MASKARHYKTWWVGCKAELADELEKAEDHVLKLTELREKKNEYLGLYRDEVSTSSKLQSENEDLKDRITTILAGKEGWLPISEYSEVKAELESTKQQSEEWQKKAKGIQHYFHQKINETN